MNSHPPDFRLREATASDLPAVLALLSERKLAPNHVEAQFGPQYVLAVGAGDTVLGVAGVERYGEFGLFRSAAVRADAAGLGVGTSLTWDRIAWARGSGVVALYLLTETAAEYWPRFGFETIARDAAPEVILRSPEWAGGCPASAVAMRLELARSA